MDTYSVTQGVALAITVNLEDDQGNPITGYAGSEALTARAWPGGNLPTVLTPSASWLDPPAGTISILITAAQTSALAEGRYRGTLDVQDPTLGPLEAYAWSFDVLPAPGSAAAPKTYCGMADLLKYGRGWLRTLQTEDDEAGFLEQCGRARSWLDDLIVAAWPGQRSWGMDPDGFGPPIGGYCGNANYPSIWLRQQLDAGGLAVRDLVKEIAAKKALGFLCEGQVGPTDKATEFARLARYYHREANALAMTLRAEINTQADGYPQFVVTLGTRDMRG